MNIRNVHINIIILLIIMQTRHIVPHPLFCSECLDRRQDSRYHPQPLFVQSQAQTVSWYQESGNIHHLNSIASIRIRIRRNPSKYLVDLDIVNKINRHQPYWTSSGLSCDCARAEQININTEQQWWPCLRLCVPDSNFLGEHQPWATLFNDIAFKTQYLSGILLLHALYWG